ncbi:Superoxide dismutase [Halotydeus destructor]|nr:Superoxide dismutase [Halotydeus destructor]
MQNSAKIVIALVILTASLAVGFIFGYLVASTVDYESGVAPDITKAICTFSEFGVIQGTVTITENKEEEGVFIGANLTGSEGRHGFHIHALGDLGDSCRNASGHYNPEKKHHGSPIDAERHVGDLGNIEFSQNSCTFNITDRLVRLRGAHSVIGRSIVIHQKEDDLGRGMAVDSKSSGAAGPRISCCVIGIAQTTG